MLNERNPKAINFKDDDFIEGSQSLGKGAKYVNPFEQPENGLSINA